MSRALLTTRLVAALLSGFLAVTGTVSAAAPAGGRPARQVAAPAASGTAASPAAGTCAEHGRTLVPRCGVWWGMWPRTRADGTPATDLPGNVASLEAALGRRLDVVSRYRGWGENVLDGWDAGLRDSGHIVLEDLTARVFGARTTTYVRWADIAAGRYDGYLRAQGARVRAFRAPVFLSFGQEPEQALQAGLAGTPEEYAAAYRHVHDVVVASGGTNAVWVWWVMGWSAMDPAYQRLWPGAGHVDWIGYDPYNFARCHGGTDRSPGQVFTPWYRWVSAQRWADGKPLMLAEYGSHGLDQGQWYAGVPAALAALPRIRAAVEFDSHPGACDHRVTGSASNWAGFRRASAQPLVNPATTRQPSP